jgi:hypothetical protein
MVAYVDDLSAASPESSDCAGLIARSPLTEMKQNENHFIIASSFTHFILL